MSFTHIVRVDSGKYEFRKDLGNSRILILRHGEIWHYQSTAFNAIASLMAELDAARVVIEAARTSDPAVIEAALKRHEGLVDDHELPSEWCGVSK